MVIASVLTVSACQTVDSISVKTAPQTTYLVGQNLNLTGGELTAVTNNGEEVISMTSSDVSVSGYNAQQKGTQTLTVSYKNASTTLEVKVVDRVTAENYNKDYFVGDTFDTSAGRIRITRDIVLSISHDVNDNTYNERDKGIKAAARKNGIHLMKTIQLSPVYPGNRSLVAAVWFSSDESHFCVPQL